MQSDPTDRAVAHEGKADDVEIREEFRRALVELMLTLVETWERTTRTSRLELAEKSRIWRVNIDDGRLRARAMERYLSLAKMPRNPRWRDVLRTAYFVLGQCESMPERSRDELQRKVDAVLAYTKRDALVR
jgi:two-component system, sensor histidine kinase ChiS